MRTAAVPSRIAACLALAAAVITPAAAAAQATNLARPPDTRLYFDVPAGAPLVAQLLAQAGCEIGSAETVRIELPGSRFDPPLAVDVEGSARNPDGAAPAANPLAALAAQVAALRAGDVERAVAGWAPDARPTARALLGDPDALERYRAQADAVQAPTVDAIAWLDTDEGPAAVLLSAGGLTPWALGMPVGYRRSGEAGFLLTLVVALDPRLPLVGRAMQEEGYGVAGREPGTGSPPPGTVLYEEVCGDGG